MASSQRGDVHSLEANLDYGARLEAQDDEGYTALMYAANVGRDEAVRRRFGATARMPMPGTSNQARP